MLKTKNTNNDYPSRDECLQLLAQAGCPTDVINHVLVVTDLALKIASRFPDADRALVEAGALLHDIGRARTHGILHGVEGGRIARELNLPVEIINIIERHLGAGIPKQDAVTLGLPARDFVPQTIEERIIAQADNLVEGDKRVPIKRSLQILIDKGLPAVAERMERLYSELSAEAGIEIDEI